MTITTTVCNQTQVTHVSANDLQNHSKYCFGANFVPKNPTKLQNSTCTQSYTVRRSLKSSRGVGGGPNFLTNPVYAATRQKPHQKVGGRDVTARGLCRASFSNKTKNLHRQTDLQAGQRCHHQTRRQNGFVITVSQQVFRTFLQMPQHRHDDSIDVPIHQTRVAITFRFKTRQSILFYRLIEISPPIPQCHLPVRTPPGLPCCMMKLLEKFRNAAVQHRQYVVLCGSRGLIMIVRSSHVGSL